MIHQKQLDNIYKQLTPTQAAAMAFEACVEHSFNEVAAIAGAQPKLNTISLPLDYVKRSMGLYQFSLFYGACYWKSRTALMQVIYERNDVATDTYIMFVGSLEAALHDACKSLGVDPQAIKKVGMVTEDDAFMEHADPTITDEYIQMFLNLAQ